MRAWLVDTFTDGDFLGNPAAVVLGDDLPDAEMMQSVAHRLAQPTTAFLAPVASGEYRIRWFTPYKEINLCGHATIASARFLYDSDGGHHDILRFVSGNGPLYTERSGGRIAIDMPRADVTPCAAPEGLREAIGTEFLRCADSSDDLLIEVASEAAVLATAPKFAELAKFPYRGHIVTAAGSDVDFVSRTFFPSLGVDEDQVCVSAHCKLGPYWGARLGRTRLSGLQLSERGGRLDVEVGRDRIKIFGTARLRPSPVVVPETGEIAALG